MAKKKIIAPTAYLTKRILVSASRKGIRKAAAETMQVMGYTVIAQNGWVVRKFPDGHIERITPLSAIEPNHLAKK